MFRFVHNYGGHTKQFAYYGKIMNTPYCVSSEVPLSNYNYLFVFLHIS